MRESAGLRFTRTVGKAVPAWLLATILAVSLGCPAETPEPGVEEIVPPLLDFPASYRVEATGSVFLDDTPVDARLRIDYLVYPDDRVGVTTLATWIDDVDLVVPFLWWEAAREHLRCTHIRQLGPLAATLDGTVLTIAAGAADLSGVSYTERQKDGTCAGEGRVLALANPTELTATHDPEADHFALTGAFDIVEEGNDFTLRLDFEGDFFNRPPVAVVAYSEDGGRTFREGCPEPKSLSNTPEGLRLSLESRSFDPDRAAPEQFDAKRPRADLSFEQWMRSRADGGVSFEFLGEGRTLEPVTFEADREHTLLVTVTDRSGSRAREICRFHVATAGGAS